MRSVTTTTTRSLTTLYYDDDIEVELQFKPADDSTIMTHHDADCDRLVVAYLVEDNDGSAANPIEDGCANGALYTYSRRFNRWKTDNNAEVYAALGLDSNGTPDIDIEFLADQPWVDYNGIEQKKTTLRDLAADKYVQFVMNDDDLASHWSDYLELQREEGEILQIDERDLRRDLVDMNGCFSEEIDALAISLYAKYWKRIVGPYTVPVYACPENSNYRPTTWDGDHEDPPSGVWVACKDAIENLTYEGKVPTEEEVVNYAANILEEYSAWAGGEVFGCVAEMFERQEDNTWLLINDESCWCFIGIDYAKQTLKDEFFDPFVKEHTTV